MICWEQKIVFSMFAPRFCNQAPQGPGIWILPSQAIFFAKWWKLDESTWFGSHIAYFCSATLFNLVFILFDIAHVERLSTPSLWHDNLRQRHENWPRHRPKSIQNRPKINQNHTQRPFESDLGKRSVPGMRCGSVPDLDFDALWRHLGVFGCHFGPGWVPEGVPKSTILAWNFKKHRKHEVRERVQENTWFLIEISRYNIIYIL